MAVIFVSRHPGAQRWLEMQDTKVDYIVGHLEPGTVRPGDIVIGTLPVHLAAEVCRQGAQYWHLSMRVPPEWRGREFETEQMLRWQARLECFDIEKSSDLR